MLTIILVCPADRLPTRYRQVANRSPTVGQHFGPKHNTNCWPTVSRLLAESIPTVGRRLLGRMLKVGVQILCVLFRRRHASRGVWGHAPSENFEKLKPHKRDFCDSDSCKRLSIYLLNCCFSLIILLSYPFLNLPCLTLNYIWDRNSSCYEE